jgi:hypothetical protein
MSAHCPPVEQLERLLDDRLEIIEDAALGLTAMVLRARMGKDDPPE